MNNEVINNNPAIAVWLIDFTDAQTNILRCVRGQILRFRINENKRVEVCTLESRYLGIAPKKDLDGYECIYKYPSYFEGVVVAKTRASASSYKVQIAIRVKKECSLALFLKDESVLNKLVVLSECFNVDDVVQVMVSDGKFYASVTKKEEK